MFISLNEKKKSVEKYLKRLQRPLHFMFYEKVPDEIIHDFQSF